MGVFSKHVNNNAALWAVSSFIFHYHAGTNEVDYYVTSLSVHCYCIDSLDTIGAKSGSSDSSMEYRLRYIYIDFLK